MEASALSFVGSSVRIAESWRRALSPSLQFERKAHSSGVEGAGGVGADTPCYFHAMRADASNNYCYNPVLRARASELRKNMTKAEACLWKYALRAGGVKAYGFHRQRPVLRYIADFFCSELMLIIEVDGPTHDTDEAEAYDDLRTARLEEVGFRVVRFTNEEVLTAMDGVRAELERVVDEIERGMGDRSRESWRDQR